MNKKKKREKRFLRTNKTTQIVIKGNLSVTQLPICVTSFCF